MAEMARGIARTGLDETLFPRSWIGDGDDEAFGMTTYYQWWPPSTMGNIGPRGHGLAEPTLALCPRCHMSLPVSGKRDC
jgi:hypothetical protein